MSKQGGLGCAFYVAGYDVGGDTQTFQLGGGPAALDVTDITQAGFGRLGGQRDGKIDWVSYMDPAAGASHVALSGLPTADVIASAFINPLAIGTPAACINAKQLNYDGNRQADGMLTFQLNTQGNGFALEWGTQLTAGKRTDTAATNGASNNDGAATAFGAQAYLQVFAFTGTDCTVTIQDSADNVTFANVAGLSFTAVTSAPQAQRISISNVSTLRQYVRAITTTSGGFTSITFAVVYVRNLIAGQVF